MRRLIDTVFLRVVAGDSVADNHARRPQFLCAQPPRHALADDDIGHDQRVVLVGESQFLRDLLQALPAELLHVLDELLNRHGILVAVLLEAAYQFRDIIADHNQVFNLLIFQIHCLEDFHLLYHHLLDLQFILRQVPALFGKLFPHAHGAESQMLGGQHLSL